MKSRKLISFISVAFRREDVAGGVHARQDDGLVLSSPRHVVVCLLRDCPDMRAQGAADAFGAEIRILGSPIDEGAIARRVNRLVRIDGDDDPGRDLSVGNAFEEAGTEERNEILDRQAGDAVGQVGEVRTGERVEFDLFSGSCSLEGILRHAVCARSAVAVACSRKVELVGRR